MHGQSGLRSITIKGKNCFSKSDIDRENTVQVNLTAGAYQTVLIDINDKELFEAAVVSAI